MSSMWNAALILASSSATVAALEQRAREKGGVRGTGTAAYHAQLGHPVLLVRTTSDNMPIDERSQLAAANCTSSSLLSDRREQQGYTTNRTRTPEDTKDEDNNNDEVR